MNKCLTKTHFFLLGFALLYERFNIIDKLDQWGGVRVEKRKEKFHLIIEERGEKSGQQRHHWRLCMMHFFIIFFFIHSFAFQFEISSWIFFSLLLIWLNLQTNWTRTFSYNSLYKWTMLNTFKWKTHMHTHNLCVGPIYMPLFSTLSLYSLQTACCLFEFIKSFKYL